jgi:acyl-CoA synthetase (AMP-forming)/AMP-acid ligase II/acyl carrier protein
MGSPTDRLAGSRTMVPDLLGAWADADGDRAALIVDGGGWLTYRQWATRSSAVARGLPRRGLRPGERIALFFDNDDWLDFAVAYMGVLKAGGVAVPLSSRFGPSELSWVLEHCQPSAMIHGRVDPPQRGPGWAAAVGQLLEDDRETDNEDQSPPPRRSEELAELLYTSGTTGRPKAVTCTHQHAVQPLIEAVDWYPTAWRAAARGVYLHANSVSTAAGQLRLLEPLGPLGMTTVALPIFDADRYCALIAEHGAAVVQLVPAMALTILATGAHRRHDLSSVRAVVFGCAPLPASAVPDLARAFPTSVLVNMYELSEARHVGTYAVCGQDQGRSLGRPRGNSEVRIVDRDGHPLPPGEVGEICLRWPGLSPQSYFRDAAATAAVFGDGWTRTGDVGRFDDEEGLTLVDRLKDVIISGGHSISSVEVEDVLGRHPAVAEVVVFGVPHDLEGEEVCAAVVLTGRVTPEELRSFVRARLAAHKTPKRIIPVDTIPKNRSGKPLKRSLRTQYASAKPAAPGAPAGPGPADDALLAAVRSTWQQVLGVEAAAADDFLALGGDSLRASQVAASLCDTLGVRLTVADLFEHRTLKAVTAAVQDALHSGATAAPAPIPRLPRPANLLTHPAPTAERAYLDDATSTS